MEATDLRILNYVKSPYGLSIVYGINKECIQITLPNNDTVFDFNDDEIQPIELTEELLLKCGANKSIAVEESFLYSRFRLFWKSSYNYWYVVDSVTNTYMTKIEFLHEWQNFIQVMDENELQIIL